jgi:glycosyltransferase involved in cell wall biosynthesis
MKKKLYAMQWELELEDTVIFTGKQDKYAYMPAFDLFLLPSYNEPFALVVLESMSVGVPVLSFDSGGTAEAVTDGVNGFILKEMTAKALAARILELSKNRSLIKKAGKNALATIKKRFTVERQVREIKNMIESTLV